MAQDHEQREFFHIRSVVPEPARLVQNLDDVGRKVPVVQPEYWRNRIKAVLPRPGISGSTVALASVLLAELDGIADTLKNAG